jgi:hypothetical protein
VEGVIKESDILNTSYPRKARATKNGKVHYVYGNMSLCLQYVGDDEVADKDVDCKRCLSKFEKINKGE